MEKYYRVIVCFFLQEKNEKQKNKSRQKSTKLTQPVCFNTHHCVLSVIHRQRAGAATDRLARIVSAIVVAAVVVVWHRTGANSTRLVKKKINVNIMSASSNFLEYESA